MYPTSRNYSVKYGPNAKEIAMGTPAESPELRFWLYLFLVFRVTSTKSTMLWNINCPPPPCKRHQMVFICSLNGCTSTHIYQILYKKKKKRNIWGWPISFTLERRKQCETPNNACEDQNKWYKPVKWLIKSMKKHWLTNTHWIEIVKKSGPVGELNPAPPDVRPRTPPPRHTGPQRPQG